ncbi:MAG: gliding motility-associated-like protein [Arenicella sp.]|jgi:gliding motility-associated-like protein
MKKLLLVFGIILSSVTMYAQEICDNGIDDDADGDIDMNDADCACSGIGGGGSTVTSLIPNPSFEDFTCCPNGVSDLPCAVSWQQASNATSDYFNTCGYTGIFNSANLPLPGAPGGAGYAGFYSNANWEENIGACLNSPMTAGVDYQMDLNLAWSTGSQTLDLSIYGTPNCGDLPWNTSTCAPGSGGWILLGTTTVTFAANQSWQQVSVFFTPPSNIAAVSIGGPCGGQQAGSNYYFLDELTLATEAAFSGGAIVETGGWCSNDLDLEAEIDTVGGGWQWFDAGIAMVGETNQNLNGMPYGPGDYTAVYTLNGDCQSADHTITIPAAPVADFNFTNQCDGTALPFTDASTIPAPEVITNWDWDFGDGNVSIGQNPSNPYADEGTYTVSLTATDGNGCTNTSTQDITVYPNPTADIEFIINGVSSNTGLAGGCIADLVSFGNSSSITAPDNITTWAWDFGDGSTSNLQNPPAKNYAAAGNYNITLTTTSNNGCTDNVVIPITIAPSPVASFTVVDDCAGIAAAFVNTSTVGTGVITQWDWTFGDGNISALENPNHPYGTSGTYTVDLIITSDLGCTSTIQGNTTRFPNPTSDFTITDECEYNASTIANNSTIALPDIITTFAWDYGDGNISGVQNPGTHPYGTFGNYNAQLTVTSSNGCTDISVVPVDIHPEPTASYTIIDECLINNGSFTNTSSVISGAISTYQWDMGDGNTYASTDVDHPYAVSGTYITELIAITDMGCEDTMTFNTTRYAMPTADFTVTDMCVYDPITVNDNSTVLAPEVISTHGWTLGDGNIGAGTTANHQYAAAGTYDVTLLTTTANGCTDQVMIPVTIYPQPVADFVTTAICVNTPPTSFGDMSTVSSGAINDWAWDFGDGQFGSGQGTQHAYGVDGNFMANLTVTSDFGCVHSLAQNVIVHEKPTAAFVSNINQICSPGEIIFSDLSFGLTSPVTQWNWDFYGGLGTSGASPIVSYVNNNSAPELYDVELIVTNGLGCKDTAFAADYIEVFPTPEARFGFSPNVLTITDSETQFSNGSINADEYDWTFGDNSLISNLTNPTHTYPNNAAGSYQVELIAYNYGRMCSDTTTMIVDIQDVVIFYVPNIFTPDGDDYNEIWKPVFFSGYDPYDYHMTVFNRYGEIVWESYNADNGWNGHYGNGGLVDDGTYVWSVDFKETMSDKRHRHNGHVTVLK